MKPYQIDSGSWHQCRQSSDEIEGLKDDLRRAIPIRRLQLIPDIAIRLNAIKHPKRLKKEYENRLNRMEGDTRNLFDTTVLTKQKALLKKGKSRLIDSCASSIIDKEEFEPKIKGLKMKLAQIDEQIERNIKTEGVQHELFLVINRLEEFAKKVDVTLEAVDFNTKREIIRALVKRVEIYKEEVVVVFRIDPEAPANNVSSRTSSPETGGSIMHSCNRRNDPALW